MYNIYIYICIHIYIYIYIDIPEFKESDGSAWVSTSRGRICRRHSHRAEKLIEFGTKRINMTNCVLGGLASGKNYGVIHCRQGFWSTAPTAPIWMETTVLERHPLHSSHFILLPCWLLDVRRVQWRFVWNVLQQAWYLYKLDTCNNTYNFI